MKLNPKPKATAAVAAGAVIALALLGGTYAAFNTSDTAPGQVISSATSRLTFTPTALKQNFGATYAKLAAGDSMVSFIDLKNSGSNALESFTISQASTGDKTTLETAGTEGLSVKIERTDTAAVALATAKLSTLTTAKTLASGPVAAGEVAHLKFTVTLDQGAVTQNQTLTTIYTVNAGQVVAGAQAFGLAGTMTGTSVAASWTPAPGATSYTLTRIATDAEVFAQFTYPRGVAVDSNGFTYVADTSNHRIRKITAGGVVSTLAGSDTAGFADGTGADAHFNRPSGVAVGAGGNLYVADSNNHRIRKVTPAGVVTTLAGSTQGGADGFGPAAGFNAPAGVAVGDGTVYVADTGSSRIRKVSIATGEVTSLAGNYAGFADGTGTAALFNQPTGVAVDAEGTVYVADNANHMIRKVTAAGEVTTLAGSGTSGNVDGPGGSAQFNGPNGVALGPDGTLYVAEHSNNRIRKVSTATREVTTLAGSESGFADGTGAAAQFAYPNGVAIAGGTVYVADSNNNRIRKITPAGEVTTLAGSGITGSADTAPPVGVRSVVYTGNALSYTNTALVVGTSYTYSVTVTGPGTVSNTIGPFLPVVGGELSGTLSGTSMALSWATMGSTSYTLTRVATTGATQFGGPTGVAVGPDGTTYVADVGNNRIRKITTAGVVTTLAGSTQGFADGLGAAAQFYSPKGVAVGSDGTVYVADTNNNRIRKITPGGGVTTLAGGTSGWLDATGTAAQFNQPNGLAVDSVGTVYVADTTNNRIRKIAPSGDVSTLAGSELAGNTAGFANGPGLSAQFNGPRGVAVGSDGTVYVADRYNNRIRKISTAGDVSTLAGDGSSGSGNGPGLSARFYGPTGVAVGSDGTVYVADRYNNRIRKITTAGDVSTLAGSSTSAFADGASAQFNRPTGLAVAGGTVYVADEYNNRIRKVTTAGMVTTLAGSNTSGSADGTGPPVQVTTDVYSGPNVYYADTTLVPGTWYTYTVTPLERGYQSNTIGPFKP